MAVSKKSGGVLFLRVLEIRARRLWASIWGIIVTTWFGASAACSIASG